MYGHASYAVAPNTYFAWIGRDVVTLDVVRGAYSCWVDAATYVTDAGCGRVIIPDGDVAETLIEYGLIVEGETARGGPATIPLAPTYDHQDVAAPTGSFVERVQFAGCVARMAIDYHGRSLSRLVGLARRETLPHSSSTDEIVRRAALFASWAPWAPFQGVCLYRSFLLLRFLRAGGLSATWVFGVRTWPFSAHCWLQFGSLLLDDDIDRVGTYTPILAV